MPQTEERTYWAVKVLRPGRKQWWFLSNGGRCNHLRVHALQYAQKEHAEMKAAEIERDNPGVKCRVQLF